MENRVIIHRTMGVGQCVCVFGCVAILAAAGVLTWRYGPWNDDNNKSDTASGSGNGASLELKLTAENTCDSCCNTLPSNCALTVDQVLFPLVHNAMSSYRDYFVAANNNLPAEDALVAGFRGLMLDSCICESNTLTDVKNFFTGGISEGLGFCHGTCDVGVRDPHKLLGSVKSFLDVNPNEVLMLEFEIKDNSLEDLFLAIDRAELIEYIYRPESKIDIKWPTLQQLIDDNTRLLIFAHGDGIESCQDFNCPEGILYTFDHWTQTNWNDDTCDIKGSDIEPKTFFLMNHWLNSDLNLPSRDKAEEFNTFDKLVERFKRCQGRLPNIVAVDFWDVGDVLAFVKEVNTQKTQGLQ